MVAEAQAALAKLDGIAYRFGDVSLLRRPSLRREAQSTSALEGTHVPFPQVLATDNTNSPSMPADLREVLNFEDMAELAFEWPLERPLSVGMLCQLQETLVRHTPGEQKDTGQLRENAVLIGQKGRGFEDARFVPGPPGDPLLVGVQNWLDWVNSPSQLSPIVRAALAHYQFETLHPFSDGNGRLGRLIIMVQLMRANLLREPLLVVSPWFERRRAAYQDGLFEVSVTGEWEPWVRFFAQGMAASADDARRRLERLFALQENFTQRVRDGGRAGSAERIAADLIENPFPTAPQIAKAHNMTNAGARLVLKHLVELEILSVWKFKGAGRTTRYVAQDVVTVLSDEE